MHWFLKLAVGSLQLMRRQTVQCIITEIIRQYTTVSIKGEGHIWDWKVLRELSKSLEVVAISSSMFGSHWKLGWYRCKNLMHFTHTVSLWGWSVFLSNHIHTSKDINNSKNNSNNRINWYFLSVFKFAQTSRTVQLFYL